MSSILIFEPLDFSDDVVNLLEANGFTVDLNLDTYSIQEALDKYDVLYMRLSANITKSTITECRNIQCKYLVIPATGIDHIDEHACAEAGIQILSFKTRKHLLRDIRATAELTLGLTISLLRKIPSAVRNVHEGFWKRDDFRGHDIYNKTVGIVGYGRLGTIVASYFQVLGAKVQVYELNAAVQVPSDFKRVDSLQGIFSDSDIISIHVDYTPRNHDLVSSNLLSICQKRPVLINTSRGQLIDEAALLSALDSGLLSGAALDVIKGELEYGKSSPLYKYAREHDNLIITPHIGGCTIDSTHQTELIITQVLLKEYER